MFSENSFLFGRHWYIIYVAQVRAARLRQVAVRGSMVDNRIKDNRIKDNKIKGDLRYEQGENEICPKPDGQDACRELKDSAVRLSDRKT